MLMSEPILRRGLEIQPRIVNSLYPIAVRYNAPLPKCFIQYKDYSNYPAWEETLKLQDMRPQSHKVPVILKVVADQPIPLCCSLFYYEVSITAKSQCGSLRVGFSFEESDKAKHRRYANFIGYHSNTGTVFVNDGDSSLTDEDSVVRGPPFGVGDVIGCGVNFVNNSFFFTKNGIFIGTSVLQTKLARMVTRPCVEQVAPATALIANFGQRDFVFEVAQLFASERASAVAMAIGDKLTPDLANVRMQSLVFDYLLRHGYLETASALARPSSTTTTITTATAPASNGVNGTPALASEAPSTNGNATPPSPASSPTVEAPTALPLTTPSPSASPENGVPESSRKPTAPNRLSTCHFLSTTATTSSCCKSTPTTPSPATNSLLSPKLRRWARKWSLKEIFAKNNGATTPSSPSLLLRFRRQLPPPPQQQPQQQTATRRDSLESPMTETEFTPSVEEPTGASFTTTKPKEEEEDEEGKGKAEEVEKREECSAPGGWECGGGERWPETPEAANQRIRLAELISKGHYLKAIAQLGSEYAGLVETMPSIVFMLRCRHFIELLFTSQRSGDEAGQEVEEGAVKTPQPEVERKASASGRAGTFKRPQPMSSPECSPVSSPAATVHQPAAVRRKCEDPATTLNGNGATRVECVRQKNGGVVASQPPLQLQKQQQQNGASKAKDKPNTATAAPGAPESLSNGSVPHQNGHNNSNCVQPKPAQQQPQQCKPCENSGVRFNGVASSGATTTSEVAPNGVKAENCDCGGPWGPADLSSVVQMGRELREKARELQTKNALSADQIALLQDAFSLIAYENPYKSPFADLMHPRHRKNLAESVNNAILVNLGKARYPLLEIGIGMLEEIVLDGRVGDRSGLNFTPSETGRRHRKKHNQASISSAGSTLTPSHTVSSSVNIPPSASSNTVTTTAAAAGSGRTRHRNHHHHHHRSATSSLVVTSTTTATASAATNPMPFLTSLPLATATATSTPPPTHRSTSSSTSSLRRRLRNTVVQSSPRVGGNEDEIQEIIVSGRGLDWATATAAEVAAEEADEGEEQTAAGADSGVTVAVAQTGVAVGTTTTTTYEIEEVHVFQEAGGAGGRIRVDRYAPSSPPPAAQMMVSMAIPSQASTSPPPPPLQNPVDVRAGGSEIAGFFHPVLFVPPLPSTK